MRNWDLLLLSSHEPDHTGADRSIRERHPTTGANAESGSFKRLTVVLRVTTYQTESINIGMLAHVVGQVPVRHPRVYNGERRGI